LYPFLSSGLVTITAGASCDGNSGHHPTGKQPAAIGIHPLCWN